METSLIIAIVAGISLVILPGFVMGGIFAKVRSQASYTSNALIASVVGYIIAITIVYILEAIKVTCTYDCGTIFVLFLPFGLLNILGGFLGAHKKKPPTNKEQKIDEISL